MHDCNGTTTRMKQRPDFCMSDVISILELLEERGEGLLKASVDEALMTSLLSALIGNHTHRMTAKQQELNRVSLRS